MIQVSTFTEGKTSERNEDYFAYTDTCFVLVDGATDKSDHYYDGKTGGEIVSRLAAQECLHTELNGKELIAHTNQVLKEKYKELGILARTTVEAWEKTHQEVEQEDPFKYKRYKSTKSKDDRTVPIITTLSLET